MAHDLENLTVITGGARSGKSLFAEKKAAAHAVKVAYIATMEAITEDPEAIDRIKRHQSRRPQTWLTVEQPLNAHTAVLAIEDDITVCIFDCLSLYVSNLVLDRYDQTANALLLEQKVLDACQLLLEAIADKRQTTFYVVTNEVGWGIVPENGLARLYRDLLGTTNQLFAQKAKEVWLSCSGQQIRLKPGQNQL